MSRSGVAYRMRCEGRTKASDFPIDHRGMDIAETPEMRQIRAQIDDLNLRYAELREAEQKRLWRGFLAVLREQELDKVLRW